MLALSIFALALVVTPSGGFASRVTPINVPGATLIEALGISSKGIVGEYGDATFQVHGFLLDGGVFTTIDVPGSLFTVAQGIASPGGIVGLYEDAS